MHSIENKRVSLVLLGDFNPKIFQPAWFVAQKLLPEQDEQDASISAISNDVCAFKTTWIELQVLHQRFQASPREDGHDEELRDLVAGTFRVLRHTPVNSFGMNVENFELRENAEDMLAGAERFLETLDAVWEPSLAQAAKIENRLRELP